MSSPPQATTGSPALNAKKRRPRYLATVKRTTQLTPRMVRVTFTGDELANFGWNGPAAHIKVIFATEMSEDSPRPTMRTYTPRRFDAQTRELDVDFVIHGEGPASTWAEQAKPGQQLLIAGPGRNYEVDAAAEWFVLAGDDSALPAIATILEALPPSAKAFVILEVVDQSEQQKLTSRAALDVTWLHRATNAGKVDQALEAALRRFDLPPGAGHVYVACESNAMRRIRRDFLMERRFERTRLVTRGYWKLGDIDHPDHDYGQEADE